METGRRLCKQATQLRSDWPRVWRNLTRLAVTSELLRESVLMSESHRRTHICCLGSFFVSHLCSGVRIFFSFKFNKVPRGSVQSTNHVAPSPGSYSLSVSLSVKSGFILICSKHTVINLKTDRETDSDWHRHQKTSAAELTEWMPTSESMLKKKKKNKERKRVVLFLLPQLAFLMYLSSWNKEAGFNLLMVVWNYETGVCVWERAWVARSFLFLND